MSRSTVWFLVAMGIISNTVVILQLHNRIQVLEETNKALQEVQTGQDIHLRFVDSDHAKLGNDIGRLRQDLDDFRYHHVYVDER